MRPRRQAPGASASPAPRAACRRSRTGSRRAAAARRDRAAGSPAGMRHVAAARRLEHRAARAPRSRHARRSLPRRAAAGRAATRCASSRRSDRWAVRRCSGLADAPVDVLEILLDHGAEPRHVQLARWSPPADRTSTRSDRAPARASARAAPASAAGRAPLARCSGSTPSMCDHCIGCPPLETRHGVDEPDEASVERPRRSGSRRARCSPPAPTPECCRRPVPRSARCSIDDAPRNRRRRGGREA